jgi:hypothetical protein
MNHHPHFDGQVVPSVVASFEPVTQSDGPSRRNVVVGKMESDGTRRRRNLERRLVAACHGTIACQRHGLAVELDGGDCQPSQGLLRQQAKPAGRKNPNRWLFSEIMEHFDPFCVPF